MSVSRECLHPTPGWGRTPSPIQAGNVAARGRHCILELYRCNRQRLDDETFLAEAIRRSAQCAGATLLQLITHRFSPQGVTGLALLAESHISIHTWPELGYAAVDVFTCGDHTMPEKACRELAARLQAGEQRLQSLRRDTPPGLPTPSRALARP